MSLLSENRQIELVAPVLPPPGDLVFRRLHGREGLSQLFEYDVELVSRSELVDLDKVLGHAMAISLDLPGGGTRWFHGYVSSFAYVDGDGEWNVYRARVVPWLWKLTRASSCRIFQKQTVPEIVAKILNEHGITDVETHYLHPNRARYQKWEYCVQYRETDFNFVSRLLESEGVHYFYFFKHQKDKHVLVLTDSVSGHEEVPGHEVIKYRLGHLKHDRDERIWAWQVGRRVLSDTWAARDFDFEDPGAALLRSSGSAVARKHPKGRPAGYEMYDQPEPVVQQDGYDAQLVEDMARIRIEEAHAHYETISARTDARALSAGALFKVANCPRKDQDGVKLLVTSTEFQLHMDVMASGGGRGGEEAVYECDLVAIDSRQQFRPPRATPKPVVQGPQSATVAGPSGQPVWTDKYGRVKVKFHWDREGKADQSASCWVRVAQNWAGANWGAMFLPHVGQEVLVGFIEGDPDRPVVVGRVYNARNMPPLTLPDNQYKSIIRDHFGNEIVLDGTPGKEHMSFHSPSHYSGLQLGRSTKRFTHSTDASYGYDSESYSFGKKISYTKGESFSIDRGAWFGVKAGAGASVSLASEVAIAAGTKLSFTAGPSFGFTLSTSFQWGAAREFKRTKGTFKRSSASDLILDSEKTVFLTGGENDNTMLSSDDKEIFLSFDNSDKNRAAEVKAQDAWAAKVAGLVGAGIASLSALSIWAYERQLPKRGPVKDPNAKTDEIWMDYEKVSSLSLADTANVAAAVGSIALGISAYRGKDIEPPSHKAPSARISLRDNELETYAGKAAESAVLLSKDNGISNVAKKAIAIKSEEDGVTVTAKKELALESDDQVHVKAKFVHKNMVILP